ncbi:MAG: FAD-binding protein [Acidobacteriaceae bacterium]
MVSVPTNWAGNIEYHSRHLHTPGTLAEVQQVVKSHRSLKVLGTRHSFNRIADTTGQHLSLQSLDQIALDATLRRVTVGAGVSYGQLAPYLDAHGFALHNLASLPHISVVGACATATHGSGSRNGSLSTAVAALEMVTADGEVVHLTREKDGEQFLGAVVGLGGLGAVTSITLDVEPAFQVAQAVYENLSMAQLERHLDAIFASGYSVSLFTDWQNHTINQVWIKSRIDQQGSSALAPEFFGATLATEKLHPLPGHSAENCTEQMGIAGPWYERLPHFRMNFTPSSGAELQTEYFVPRENGYEAILAVEELRDLLTPCLFISELRTVEGDSLWMSPCYRQLSLALHFTWKQEWPEVQKILPMMEEKLAPYNARPHWGKLFGVPPAQLWARYEKMPDFRALLNRYDPDKKFRNEFLSTNIFGE